MRSRVVDDISSIEARRWNALCAGRQPFLRHEFLAALEQSGCVAPATGWTPCHVIVEDENGELVAAAPLYLKEHSWGEFVFDFAWAEGYARAGLDYYPKLVSMSPFTPVTGQRLLVAQPTRQLRVALLDAIDEVATNKRVSSTHILFPLESEIGALADHGLIVREDCRFQWPNAGFGDFDDFLGALRSSKRKKIRRERKRVTEQGIEVVTRIADELDTATWRAVYAMIARTFVRRGHAPYLSLGFFRTVARQFGEHMLVNLALCAGETVGAAILFRDDEALYGRYWGALTEYDCLHFETCYYRGIEYCIEHGLARFDPGTQGEHKARRGFVPVRTYSAHHIADPRFRSAIEAWLDEERERNAHYMSLIDNHLPYRRTP